MSQDSLLAGSQASEQPIEETTQTVEGTSEDFNFLGSLSEDLRGEASLKDFKDVNGLAKSYVNAQRMLGGSIRIPGVDASAEAKEDFFKKVAEVDGVMRSPNPEDAEAMNQFYSKLGRPASSDQYKLEVPEGIEINDEKLAGFNQKAHELGLTQAQYEGALSALVEDKVAEAQAAHEAFETGQAKLKELWGHEYNAKLEAAKTVAEFYKEKYPAEMEQLLNSPMSNNPAVLSMLAELSNSYTEQGHIGGQSKHQFGMTPEEAMEKIVEIRNNPAHPANPLNGTGDKDAKAMYAKLYQIAYGS